VIIAAAGMGSRLGRGIPKCMLKIGREQKEVLISRLIKQLSEHVD
jgi:choline kinase